jgi:hypothetical protein
MSGGYNRFLLNPILSYASAKIMSADEPLSTKSFPKVQLAIIGFDHEGIVVRKTLGFHIFLGKVDRDV